MRGEDLRHLLALVPLNFDSAIFNSPAGSAGFLHFFGQALLFRQPNPSEVRHDCDSFAAAPRGLANNINATAILGRLPALARFIWLRLHRIHWEKYRQKDF